MITIPNMNYTADNVSLVQILNSATKVNMLKVCKKFDLYVSPNSDYIKKGVYCVKIIKTLGGFEKKAYFCT